MPAPLTERELLIAVMSFKSAMNAVLTMAECGFDPVSVGRTALNDPACEARVRAVIERDLPLIEKQLSYRQAQRSGQEV